MTLECIVWFIAGAGLAWGLCERRHRKWLEWYERALDRIEELEEDLEAAH
jgi:hypothetical protein